MGQCFITRRGNVGNDSNSDSEQNNAITGVITLNAVFTECETAEIS